MPLPAGYQLIPSTPGPPAGYVMTDDQGNISPPAQPAGLPAGMSLPQLSPHPAVSALSGAPASPGSGFFGSAADSSGLSSLGQTIAHPIKTALGIPSAISGMVKNTTGNISQGIQDYGQTGMSDTTRRDFGRAVPVIGPVLAKTQGQYDAGDYAGAAGTIAGLVGGMVAPEAAMKGLRLLPGTARGLIAGDVTKPMSGSNVTPLQRFNSARNLGVNLDAADATNSPVLGLVKRVNSNSLVGGPTYEAAKANNLSALTGSTNNFLDRLYPEDRESGGLAIQNALKRNQQGLYSIAQQGFDSLPQDVPIPGLAEVGKTAQDIGRQNAAYQDLFPSLKPRQAMNVVGDVGGLGPQAPAPIRMSPFVDERGNPIHSSSQPAPQQPASFGTGQKLRSDLLEFTRKNPDIVTNQGDGFIRQLAGQTDDALTNASSGLNPAQLDTFRSANAAWKDMKGTYDDPSSPLYHAVRTDNPSSLFSGVGPKTPENARNLLTRIGPDPAPIGALRRGTAEGALKTTNDGSPNLKTFGTQLNRIPADYRAELFSPDQNKNLFDIANTSNALSKEFNSSGSAHQLQKIGEAGSLLQAPVTALSGHPLLGAAPVAYNALQYGAAKLMNSPKLVNWLMKENPPPVGEAYPSTASRALRRLRVPPVLGSSHGGDASE